MSTADLSFRAMGCQVRLIVEGSSAWLPEPGDAATSARRFIDDFDARMSRFQAGSELCALNADPRDAVPASQLMRDLVRGALRAAQASDGLVDPTLVDELEACGYRDSREGSAPADLREVLIWAPVRRPAKPDPRRRWRQIEVDEAFGFVRRPPGLRIDSGGTGKGLAADMLAERLAGYERFVVDCGGDLRVGGTRADRDPIAVQVEHPLTKEHGHVLTLSGGAVATSGLDIRVWRRRGGGYAHHLLDPSTGEPAWTGLVGATALAATALEAETLAKAALLSGPAGAREILRPNGGLIVHDDGESEVVGAPPISPRYRITVPFPVAAPGAEAA